MTVDADSAAQGRAAGGRLDGKSILVTGGSSGLGRAMSIAFAVHGAKVTIADVRRDPRSGGEPTDEVIQSLGHEASFTQTDISQWADVDRAVAAATSWSGRLDVLVNSAVLVGEHSKGLLETTEEDWDSMMAVNLTGVFLCCKRAVSQMVGQTPVAEVRGRVINMSSQMGLSGAKGHVAYCAGKGAIVNLTRQLAVDFADRGIIVNSIAPGKIPTFPLDEAEREKDDMEYILMRTPYPRLGRPEDIAGLALFLASDECQFVTGAIIPADGGWDAS